MRPGAALLVSGALMMAVAQLGCRSPLPATPLAPDDPLPSALVASLAERASALHSVRGVANLAVDSEALRFRRPQRFAAERPDSLRVETLGLFNQIAAVLVTRDQRYQFFDASNPGLQHGRVTSDLLWQVARIDLTPEQVVALLLGAPRLPEALHTKGGMRLPDGAVRTSLADASGVTRLVLDFDAQGRLLRYEQLHLAGDTAWEARFDDYRDVGATPFAFAVELRFPSQESSAVLRFGEVELNPELAPELFELSPSSSHASRR